jgi:hypothetical protein
VDWRQTFNSFQLYNETFAYYNIQPPITNSMPLVIYSVIDLSFERYFSKIEFNAESLFVDRLQETWCGVSVDLDCSTDHIVRQSIKILVRFSSLHFLGALAVNLLLFQFWMLQVEIRRILVRLRHRQESCLLKELPDETDTRGSSFF